MIRNISLIMVFLVLLACGSAPPVPVDHFYRLTLAGQDLQKQQINDNLVYIRGFTAEGLYNERTLLYINDQQGRELRQHYYHFWVTSPPHLLQDFLIDYLRRASTASMVISGAGAGEGIEISGKVLEFVYQTADSGNAANVTLELQVSRNDNERPILIKEYNVVEAVNGKGISDVIAAFNRATIKIYDQFVTDLSEL